MKRDRVVPELEIELLPPSPATDVRDRGAHPQQSTRSSRRQVVVIAAAVVATMGVLLALGMVGDGPDPNSVTPSPATTLPSQTFRTPTPGILGTAPTDLLLWSIGPQSRLQVLDLDSGELRTLGNRGGIAFFGLLRQLVIFDGDEGSRVVTATGQTVSQNLGRGAFPVAVPDSQTLWVLSDASPRRWQRRAIDGTLLDEIPFDASVWVVPYTEHAVLLSSSDGSAWSWSPDSDWFFIKVDADRIHAVNVRDRSVPEIDIGLPLAAGQGIVVTRR